MKHIALMAVALTFSSTGAWGESMNAFAYTGELMLQGQGALYEAPLNAEAYRAIARRDLGDVRVFNSAGERVPYAIIRPAAAEREPLPPVRVPYFPMQRTGNRNADDFVVQTDRRSDGSVSATLSVHRMADAKSSITGYLVDLRTLESSIAGMRLIWESGPDGTDARADVFASDDLSTWRTVVVGAPLLQLRRGDETLLRDRIEFTSLKAKYLRLTWYGDQPPLALQRVEALPVEPMTEHARMWTPFTARAGENPGEFVFDIGSSLPVDRMRIEVPQANTVVPASMYVYEESRNEWRKVSNFVAYRLGGADNEASNADFKVFAAGPRWMLKVDPRAGDLGAGQPVLHAGWMPHRVIFNARGGGPFKVAFGNPKATSAGLSAETLVPGYGSSDSYALLPAQVENIRPNATHATGWWETLDLKRLALWGALLTAVALIAWMAWRLTRQMTRQHSAEQ